MAASRERHPLADHSALLHLRTQAQCAVVRTRAPKAHETGLQIGFAVVEAQKLPLLFCAQRGRAILGFLSLQASLELYAQLLSFPGP